MKKYLTVLPAIIFAVSCSGKSVSPKNAMIYNEQKTEIEMAQETFSAVFLKDELSERTLQFSKKEPEFHFDDIVQTRYVYDVIPLVEDSRYNHYVKRFTQDIPSVFQNWLNRSNKYLYMIKDTLRREGVPDELAYLPFTESGFNPTAVSHAGASGMWQFMRGTGKMYGLDDNVWVDERMDYEKATVAAARHFKDLYETFGDWHLALAAYNAGTGKIIRAIRMYESRDFYTLYKYGYLKRETKDYVPKYLALRYIFCNYKEYGFETPVEEPLIFDRIELKNQVNLFVVASLIGTDYKTLRDLNPELKMPVTPPVENYSLRVPYGTAEKLNQDMASMSQDALLLYKIHYGKKGESLDAIGRKYNVSLNNIKASNGLRHSKLFINTPVFIPIQKYFSPAMDSEFAKNLKPYNPEIHVVKRGETLSGIADRYGLRLNEVVAMNKGIKPNRIRPGQNLVISVDYKRSDKRYVAQQTTYTKYTAQAPKPAVASKTKHVVKNGESLWVIAQKYGTTVNAIKRSNNLSGSQILPGKVLVITD